ncbi:outer membrane beta-barrel protein [Balneolaceae bacterium ANBcel3]|nr:outer membrane beta-barrel protein [Balneolaceae bacterium ANBcel3]
MSKSYIVLSLIALCMLFSAPQSNAQGITLGGGLSYGLDIEEIGLQANGYYDLNENMRLGGDVIYWLVDSPSGIDITYMEFNFNAHYIFSQDDALTLYAIGSAGIHYADVSYSDDMGWGGASLSYSDTKLGIGIGAGVEYDLGSLILYGEPRFFLSGLDQLALNAGVRFRL